MILHLPGGMIIAVRTLTGKIYEIEADTSETIATLKEKICNRTDTKVHAQRIVFSGRELKDECTIGECGISEGSLIHLVMRLLGS